MSRETIAANLTAPAGPEPEAPDRCLTVEALARRWCVGTRRIKELIRAGIVATIDVGVGSPRRRIRITPEAVRQAEKWMTQQPRQPGRRPARDHGIDPEIMSMLTAAAGGPR